MSPIGGSWRSAVAAVALILAGCAGSTGPTPPGAGGGAERPLVVAVEADRDAVAREVVRRAATAEVVYLGELHDSAAAHLGQTAILRAMLAEGLRPALAFEMVPEGDQGELSAAVASEADAAAVAERLRWTERGWPDFRMYWPLFEQARQARLPVVAADLDAALIRRVSRGGLGAAGDAASRLASALPDDASLDRAIGRRIQAAHCNLLPEPRIPPMVDSWYARNVTIARHLVDALRTSRQVAVIIGRGHQSPGGVPAQLAVLRPGTRQLVVAFTENDAVDWGDSAQDGRVDVLWRIPVLPRPDPCPDLLKRLG